MYNIRADQIIPGMLLLYGDGTARLVISTIEEIVQVGQYFLDVGWVGPGNKINTLTYIDVDVYALFPTTAIINTIRLLSLTQLDLIQVTHLE